VSRTGDWNGNVANFIGMAVDAVIVLELPRFDFSQLLMAIAGLESIFGAAAVVCFQSERPQAYF